MYTQYTYIALNNKTEGLAVQFIFVELHETEKKKYFVELESSTVHRAPNQFWNICLAVSGSKLYLFVLMLSLFVHKHNMRKIYNVFFLPCRAGKSQHPENIKKLSFRHSYLDNFLQRPKGISFCTKGTDLN